MARINDNFLKLKAGYLFPEISRRVTAFTEANPEAAQRLIRCGIGDVTEPLPEACRKANPNNHVRLVGYDNFKQSQGAAMVIFRGKTV